MKKLVKISEVLENKENPRTIKDYKFIKLVRSIKEFPDMLEKRPIVVDENMIVLGGNMRLKACKEAGLKEVWIDVADNWSDDKKREFIIKDNVGFGEWDWDILANEWDVDKLEDWGLDLPVFDEDETTSDDDNPYTKKIEAPIYEPKDVKPTFDETYSKTKFNQLVEKIESSKLDKEQKEFLKLCATRHIVFDYQKIADVYANSDADMQDLMEDSALVIIDFDKAIENGYITLSEEIVNNYLDEYPNE